MNFKNYFFMGILCFLLISGGIVNAKDSEEKLIVYNDNNIKIDKNSYEILSRYMNENQMKMISKSAFDAIMTGGVESYRSMTIATTYLFNENGGDVLKLSYFHIQLSEQIIENNGILSKENNECSKISSTYYSCQTDYKNIQLFVKNSNGEKRFQIINRWKKIPKYKSFDVIAMRWTGNFKSTNHQGAQYTNGNSGNISYTKGNNNFKVTTSGIGLSQNLVDSATTIENELVIFGTCSGSGIIYATYQHAQGNVTLATSKSYTFGSQGMGGVLNFNASVANIYDNTPGLSLNYIC